MRYPMAALLERPGGEHQVATASDDDVILALDNGTQSMRALLFDRRGELVAKANVPLDAYYSVQPGWAEQDPDYFWEMLCNACKQLWQQPGVEKSRVKAVALTTQRGTVVNLDKDGNPLRPAIVWLDQREAGDYGRLPLAWSLLFKVIGERKTIEYFQRQTEANWLRANQPGIWAATSKYLLLSGYLTYRLVGAHVDSVACQVGYLPFDFRKQRWAANWDWKWAATGVERSMLPRLVAPAQALGMISAQASAQTGIPIGLPMIAAGADKACEILGSGCVTPELACISFGTSATINITSRRYVEAIALIPPYPSPLPGAYCTEIQIYRGFWLVSWFRDEFGHREQALAKERGVAPEKLFDELVAKIPPGSDGLLLQPYWSPGVRIPGPEARGAMIGFSDIHTRAHMYRAILEGLAYALREGKERIEKRSRVRIERIRISGGGSQSDVAMQIAADVFGLPCDRPHTYETAGLGAAIDAAVGLGWYPDFDAAIAGMTRVKETFRPQPETQLIYDRLHERVYRPLYGKLQPLYREIRRIAGGLA
jgi:sugar (pentulose or hexulose) kinase